MEYINFLNSAMYILLGLFCFIVLKDIYTFITRSYKFYKHIKPDDIYTYYDTPNLGYQIAIVDKKNLFVKFSKIDRNTNMLHEPKTSFFIFFYASVINK